MATGQNIRMVESLSSAHDVIEYHNRTHYLTILSNLMPPRQGRRLTRVSIDDISSSSLISYGDPRHQGRMRRELAGLDEVVIKFLFDKAAFKLPPKDCWYVFTSPRYLFVTFFTFLVTHSQHSRRLLQCHFDCVYPHLPVFDRIEFLNSYELSDHSSLLMLAILASSTPYVDMDVLTQCGFTSRFDAQRAFFFNAVLLYDFGCEKSQLRMLQASIILGITVFSSSLDKDYHFWHHNSVRIAVRMGLHTK
jgi:hypothetical protein